MTVDLGLARQVAEEAAEAAGAALQRGARGDVAVTAKGTNGDVVTSLDTEAERIIVERLRSAFPAHRIISEEAGLIEGAGGEQAWIVDPLDGTNNLAIGLHVYVIGIALCDHRLPVVSVVHDPIAGRTWSAVRSEAAAEPPAPSPGDAGCGPLLAWTQGYGVARADPPARALRMVLETHARRLLMPYAPLVAWTMLASGAIDGFIGYRSEPLEMPAGTLLAREAGMAIVNLDGSPFDDCLDWAGEPASFVAARPGLVEQLLGWVREAERLRPELATLLGR